MQSIWKRFRHLFKHDWHYTGSFRLCHVCFILEHHETQTSLGEGYWENVTHNPRAVADFMKEAYG